MKAVQFQKEFDQVAATAAIRSRRYGVIETSAGKLVAIHFRTFPKLLSWPEWWPVGSTYRASGQPDRCLLYYNQPRWFSNFLALKYIVSTSATSFTTLRAAVEALDIVAQIKQSDALLCDASNRRISDRLLKRFGWESHSPQRWHRNFIKRFYGKYPATALLGLPPLPPTASTSQLELAL